MKNRSIFFESSPQQIAKEYILKHVVYDFLNTSDYRELPHKKVLNFVAFYKISSIDGDEFIIEYEDLRKNQISMEELDLAARHNSKLTFKMNAIEQEITELMAEVNKDTDFEFPEEWLGLFVLKPVGRKNVTMAFFCDGLLKKITEDLDSDIYIIPSSIHELIILRKEDFLELKIEDLKAIILNVNESAVSDEDFLSNNLYEFNRGSEQPSIV